MRLDVLCVIFTGYFLQLSNGADKDKNVHVKIHAPEHIHKHSHQHTVYQKSPTEHIEIEYVNPHSGQNDHIVVHGHHYSPEEGYEHKSHVYNPEKKHKAKRKKPGKKKSKKQKKKYGDDQDYKKILSNYDANPDKSDDGGFKTSVHTEHYEVKKINPNARFPDEKYIIQGAYKVQETDPWGKPVTSFHEYDSPISKIAASILSKYDYTNFRPGEESDEFAKEKEEEHDHDDIEYDYDGDHTKKKSHNNYNSPSPQKQSEYNSFSPIVDSYGYPKTDQNYVHEGPKVNNKKDYEKTAGYDGFVQEKKAYYSSPYNQVSSQPSHEDVHSKQSNYENKNQKTLSYHMPQVYGNFKTDDSKRVEKLKTGPVGVEYVAPHNHDHSDHDSVQRELEYEFEKEFGHLVQPGHTHEPHYDYANEWEKHIIDYIYGGEHAASNKFVQKVKPDNIRRV